MPRKSINELLAQAQSSFPDNTTRDITPEKLRTFCEDFLNAISPAYGVLQKPNPSSVLYGLTPIVMIFETRTDSDPSQTTSSAAQGTITRSERGTSTINFTADLEAANGRFVSFTLYKNGVATPWRTTGNGAGTGNPVGVALTAVDYADPPAVYDIRVSAEINNVNVVVSNAALVLQLEPVRSFT